MRSSVYGRRLYPQGALSLSYSLAPLTFRLRSLSLAFLFNFVLFADLTKRLGSVYICVCMFVSVRGERAPMHCSSEEKTRVTELVDVQKGDVGAPKCVHSHFYIIKRCVYRFKMRFTRVEENRVRDNVSVSVI